MPKKEKFEEFKKAQDEKDFEAFEKTEEYKKQKAAEKAKLDEKLEPKPATPASGGVYPPSALVEPFSDEEIKKATPGAVEEKKKDRKKK
jgi:hypothetical protein